MIVTAAKNILMKDGKVFEIFGIDKPGNDRID